MPGMSRFDEYSCGYFASLPERVKVRCIGEVECARNCWCGPATSAVIGRISAKGSGLSNLNVASYSDLSHPMLSFDAAYQPYFGELRRLRTTCFPPALIEWETETS